MKLENHPIKASIVEKLKGIRTKLDADKAIDEIQQILYTARDNKTIAGGSALEKQLGEVGSFLESLKQ